MAEPVIEELQYWLQEPYNSVYGDAPPLVTAHPRGSFGYDVDIMRKYMDGRDLDYVDKDIVERLCNISFMKTGVSLTRQMITAKTIGIGRDIVIGIERYDNIVLS